MKQQILDGTDLDADEIGTIGDAAHQGTDSAHNPESPPPPGNPDDEVDALDCPHDPARGADQHKMTEAVRLAHKAGRDRRLRLVIFNGRQWSEYAKDGYPAYTWRPYYGDNQHTRHAHYERNDQHRDDRRPFELGLNTMDTKQDSAVIAGDLTSQRNILHGRMLAIQDSEHPNLNNPEYFSPANAAALKAAPGLKQIGAKLDAVAAAIEEGVDGTVYLSPEQMDELAAKVADLLLPGLVSGLSALVFRAQVPAVPSARTPE